MASIINNIERFFKQRSILSDLIAINIGVLLLVKLTGVFCMLFGISGNFILDWIELPAALDPLLKHPWTLFTYMFAHTGFWHILFNMLWLYWFGKIFLLFFNPKQLGGLYLMGGLAGGIFFILAYNLFPYFESERYYSYLIGASASVMAIVFAASFFKKDFEVNLLFLGSIKIYYLALFTLILDLLSIQSDNPGGHIAHIGGALMGIWFALAFRKGTDITAWINSIVDSVYNLFHKKPSNLKVKYKRPETDYEYNARRATENKDIDRILEKIKRSGYSSLSDEEKKKLFEASKK